MHARRATAANGTLRAFPFLPAAVTTGSQGAQSAESRMILMLAIAAFASSASMRVCDPMLPKMAADFAVSLPQASAVIACFAIAYGVLQVIYGPIGDRLGKLRVISVATLASSLASLGCALAPSLGWLVVARGVSGAIAAAIIPLSFAWIGDTVPFEQRQPVLAKFLSGSIIGVISGQLVGGLLADSVGWRAAFAVLAMVFLVAGVTLARVLWQTAAAATTGAAGPAAGATVGAAAGAAGAGAATVPAATGLFGRYITLLRAPWVRTVLMLVSIEGLLVFGAIAFVPAWLHDRHQLSLGIAGLISGVFALGGLIYTSQAARLLRRLGEHGLALSGGLTLAAGLVLMALAPGWPLTVLASLLMGVGFYAMHNTLQTHGTQLAPTQRGTGMAMFAFCYFLGQSVGVSIASAVVAWAGFAPLFVGYAAGLTVLAAVFHRALWRRHQGLAANLSASRS